MKDRVALYPGRVQLTPVAGQSNVYDMARADEPIQEGTPLNKATLLTDETAALLKLDDSAVPDDAFKKLKDSLEFKGGDILTTIRTDLDDSWILCNGIQVSTDVYNALGGVIPFTLAQEWETNDLWSSHCLVQCVTYANGYWVIGGTYIVDGVCQARIAYATSLDGEWTTKDLWVHSTSTSSGSTVYTGGIRCVTYANGYWVIAGRGMDGSNYTARIAYATSLDGEWTTKDLWSGSGTFTIANCITYADGYWVVAGVYGVYYARIAYATSLDGEWTTKNLWSGKVGTSAFCITCANGYWVVGGSGYDANGKYARIAYTTSLDGEWTTKNLWSAATSTTWTYEIRCIVYADGCWVGGGRANGGAYIAYTTSPDGEWTVEQVWSSSSSYASVNSIAYEHGRWVVGGGSYISNTNVAYQASALTLNGTWNALSMGTSPSLSVGADYPGGGIQGIYLLDGEWVLVSQGESLYGARAFSLGEDQRTLPTVTIDNAYCYIKAKE